jgi:ferric-dicitrate binding protein FerR (iron transport regulator)
MVIAQKKVRSWCDECEAWHPLGQHIAAARSADAPELRAEPRLISQPVREPRRSGWLGFAWFTCVILPAGIVAWTGAVYAVLLLWPHIKAALP